jgi:hypothetical protein
MKQQLRFFWAVMATAILLVATVFSAFAETPGYARAQAPLRLEAALGAGPAGWAAAKCTTMTASDVVWVTLTDDGEVDEKVDSYPADTSIIVPMFDYNCVPSKTTIVTVFTLDGESIFTDKEALKADTKKGSYAYPLSKKDESPIDPGKWGVQFFNNKTLLTSGTVVLGGDDSDDDNLGVTVQGTVVDKKTKKAIKSAYVFVLNPGVTLKEWVVAEYPDSDVFTSAQTDSKGKYVLESKLERKEKYSILIIAKGYKPVGMDNFTIGDKDPDPLELNATLNK